MQLEKGSATVPVALSGVSPNRWCGSSTQRLVRRASAANSSRDADGWSLDIPGLVAWSDATVPLRRVAPKARIIPAQPSGLGTQTVEVKR
jgi:hypothetical protein